jgi:hypothetical protein
MAYLVSVRIDHPPKLIMAVSAFATLLSEPDL